MGTPTIITIALAFALALALAQPLPTGAASCSSSPSATHDLASAPEEYEPPPKPPQKEDAYFCCDSLNPQGKGSGEGCEQILHTVVAGCAKVLHCTDRYTNDEGKVTCTG
ncbi:hypothetical protein [Enhygromyxa salina]|uniref:Uncharacterized protein n=1 Tax=Enhygromyxa salina TaxID=215803 RepID=A0A2S9YSR5_9BACT|nr:hypothetical protein [Enhygromyxa salina]PRQ08144.1 hypothetical protein ENSA7_21160 [Enhygromyxa salina]